MLEGPVVKSNRHSPESFARYKKFLGRIGPIQTQNVSPSRNSSNLNSLAHTAEPDCTKISITNFKNGKNNNIFKKNIKRTSRDAIKFNLYDEFSEDLNANQIQHIKDTAINQIVNLPSNLQEVVDNYDASFELQQNYDTRPMSQDMPSRERPVFSRNL